MLLHIHKAAEGCDELREELNSFGSEVYHNWWEHCPSVRDDEQREGTLRGLLRHIRNVWFLHFGSARPSTRPTNSKLCGATRSFKGSAISCRDACVCQQICQKWLDSIDVCCNARQYFDNEVSIRRRACQCGKEGIAAARPPDQGPHDQGRAVRGMSLWHL